MMAETRLATEFDGVQPSTFRRQDMNRASEGGEEVDFCRFRLLDERSRSRGRRVRQKEQPMIWRTLYFVQHELHRNVSASLVTSSHPSSYQVPDVCMGGN
jgi:hypothetical protein